MKTVTFRNPAAAPSLFASVRRSHDVSLVAFGAALLAAAALHMGAFIPRFAAPEGGHEASAARASAPVPAAAAVVATQPAPCAQPQG